MERAIYGALCGNAQAALLCCNSWEDCLWAFCNAAAQSIYGEFSLTKKPDRNNDKESRLGKIFTELEASDKEVSSNFISDYCNILIGLNQFENRFGLL